MRDIEIYQEVYARYDFERYQVKYRRKMVLEEIGKYHHDSILEIGCGLEPLFLYFKEYKQYTVVEPGKSFFDNAVILSEGRENITIINGFFEECIAQLKNNTYDMIIISGLLHELEKPENLLGKVKELCSQNTVIHVNVPNALSLHRIVAYEAGIIDSLYSRSERNIQLQQNKVFDMTSLKELIKTSLGENVYILSEGSYFIKPFTHKQMQECLEKGIIDDIIVRGFNCLSKYLPFYGSEIYINFMVE